MDPLAPLLEHPRHRMLSEPVDLQIRLPGPQFIGDGQVPAHMPEPDRRADEQRPLTAVPAPGPAPALRCPGRKDWTKSRMSRLAWTGSRNVGACPPPWMVTS